MKIPNMLEKNEAKILLFINKNVNIKNYPAVLYKKLDLSMSCCYNRINSLIDMKLLIVKKQTSKPRKQLYLTKRGEDVTKELLKLYKILK